LDGGTEYSYYQAGFPERMTAVRNSPHWIGSSFAWPAPLEAAAFISG
jgi:hypothetical protein